MGNHVIKDPPIFVDAIRRFETTDKGHADTFNPIIEVLVNNDAYLTEALDGVKARADQGILDADTAQRTANQAKADALTAQNTANQAVGKIGDLKIYYSFQEVNAGYTQSTALRMVMTAMALNSELHGNVTASTGDYPSAGILHITKTVANTASMVFDSATDKYYANVTPTNIEQIFGGGG